MSRKFISFFLVVDLFFPIPLFSQPSLKTRSVVVGDVAVPDEDTSSQRSIRSALFRAIQQDSMFRLIEAKREETGRLMGDELQIARQLLNRGKQAYQELRFADALGYLEDARKEFILKLPILRSGRDLLEVHLHIGLALASLNKMSAAQEAFRRAVYLDPKLELTTRTYSPSVVEQFSKARQQVLAPEPIKTRVEATESKASVYLNGRSVGVTPLFLSLPPGEYFILIEKEDFEPWYAPIKIAKRLEYVRAILKPIRSEQRFSEKFKVREGDDEQSPEALSQLIDIGRNAGGNLILLSEIQRTKNYRWLGQWFDVETKQLSPVAVLTMGERLTDLDSSAKDLIHTLSEFLTNGHVKPAKLADLSPESLRVAEGRPEPEFKVNAAPERAWYERWWIYPILAGAAAGIFFGVRELGSPGTTIVVNR